MRDRIRVVPPQENHYKQPRYCEFASCSEPTKDHKPFCRFHVTQTAYAQKLLEDIAKNGEACY